MNRLPTVTLALGSLVLSACGGGGGGSNGPVPGLQSSPSPAPSSTANTSRSTATPKASPTPSPTPRGSTPTPVPTLTPTPYPPDAPSRLHSTYARVGLAQIFDYFPSDGTQMPASQIVADAGRYDMVWASFDPQPWAVNSRMLISRYYIIEEDNELISGHSLSWWQQNHPDWILYACTASGQPTHDLAYTPDDGFPDVPLNMHNPAVVNYQIQQSLVPYVQGNGYNALALDQVVYTDIMEGGNPEFGQPVVKGEYGCGVWNADGTFTTVYQSTTDPTWTQDVLNWVIAAHQAASAAGISVVVNHPPSSVNSSNEQTLLQNVGVTMDEGGFSDYGFYQQPSQASVFIATYNYMEYVQRQGVGMVIIDRFVQNQTVTSDELEYSIGTYLMGNEGSADLSVSGANGPGYGYGAENYHQEYAAQLGDPCGPMYGGSAYDPNNPQMYYRRFQNGMAVVNSGSLPVPSEKATLPTDHTYTDLESRPVTNPLAVASNDAWVLLTTGGNGCF